MTFNKNRSGQILQMVNGAVYYINSDGRFAYAGVDTGAVAQVTLTGWTTTSDKGNTMWQTTGGGYIDLSDGWRGVGTATYSGRSAQSYVDEIIKNNQIILQNNLVCARFANKLTSTQLATLRGLQSRLNNRNKSLLEDGMVTVKDTSYPRGYADLANTLNEVMATGGGTSGIGVVVSTTVVIVVAAVVVASLATAAYFAYKAFANESRDDVKFSKELTRTLTSKLTEEEWQMLQDETQGIVTKARVKQSLSNLGTLGTFLLAGGVVLGGLWIYKRYFKKS